MTSKTTGSLSVSIYLALYLTSINLSAYLHIYLSFNLSLPLALWAFVLMTKLLAVTLRPILFELSLVGPYKPTSRRVDFLVACI